MSEPNPEFRADLCWQDRGGAAWVRLQDRIDVQLDPFGRAVLDKLRPLAGERALDVGCGSGQTVLELGDLVGPSGRVVGLDISEPMLGRARERASGPRYAHVELVLGDAQTQVLSSDIDLQFSRFGVMFFQDSVAAFRNLFGALKAGGRLGFVCWQAMAKNEWAQVVLQAVLPLLPSPELPPLLQPDRPGPFYFDSPERIRSILGDAGYSAIEVEPFERPLHFGAAMTLTEAVEYALEIGPAARAIADASPEILPACRTALAVALAPFVSYVGAWLGGAAFLVTARRE